MNAPRSHEGTRRRRPPRVRSDELAILRDAIEGLRPGDWLLPEDDEDLARAVEMLAQFAESTPT